MLYVKKANLFSNSFIQKSLLNKFSFFSLSRIKGLTEGNNNGYSSFSQAFCYLLLLSSLLSLSSRSFFLIFLHFF